MGRSGPRAPGRCARLRGFLAETAVLTVGVLAGVFVGGLKIKHVRLPGVGGWVGLDPFCAIPVDFNKKTPTFWWCVFLVFTGMFLCFPIVWRRSRQKDKKTQQITSKQKETHTTKKWKTEHVNTENCVFHPPKF